MGAGLMPKIAWTNAIVLLGLLALAAVALLVGDQQLADYIVGASVGAIVGSTATTLVVQQHANSRPSDTSTETPPKG